MKIVIANALSPGIGIEDAMRHSSRTPPSGSEHYVAFAKYRRCVQGPHSNIEGDLDPFRDPVSPEKRTITKHLIEEAKAYALGRNDVVLFRCDIHPPCRST